MSYSTQAKNASNKARVQIMTVDPTNRRCEGMQKDGTFLQIAVWDNAGNAFRWPQENEIWIVRRDQNIWHLDCRVQQGTLANNDAEGQLAQINTPEPVPITSMAAGQMKLDATHITDAGGNRITGTARGTGTLTGNGSGVVLLTIPHGLSAIPTFAGGLAMGWLGFLTVRAASDATNVYLSALAVTFSSTPGTAVTTGTLVNGTHYSYQWVAIL